MSAGILIALLAAICAPAFGTISPPEPSAVQPPVLEVDGLNAGALAGRSVAFADLDGDGKGDLIVGAASDASGGALAGQVLLFFGGSRGGKPNVTINGSAGERFGWSVANAGNVDGDGTDDLLVGAPFNDSAGSDAGAGYLFLGSKDRRAFPGHAYGANVTLLGSAAGEEFGYSVAGVGDANLDGYADVAVGAPGTGSGSAYVFYGGPTMNANPDKTFRGASAGDQFGFSLAGGASVDGDTSLDLAVGAPGSKSGIGSVDVILNVRRASPKIVVLSGASAGDRFGASVAMPDFNGDGRADVAVGAPGNGAGAVYVHFGSSVTGKFDPTVDRMLREGADGDGFGASLASGDPKTDRVLDLVVGAPHNASGGTDAGRAYVFYGNAGADAVPDVITQGTAAGDAFGFSVASGPSRSADFDGNGSADFAVGAPLRGPLARGAAYVYTGILVVVPANPTVFGYVLDNATKAGLANVLVTAESATISRATRTTANGSYGIASTVSVPPGTYWINASSPGYFPASSVRTLAFDTRTNVSYTLTRLPVVHGTIYDGNVSSRPPLPGATVVAMNATGALLGSTTTDSEGTYFLRLGQIGMITVKASKAGYFDNATAFRIREDQNLTKNLTLDHEPILAIHVRDGGSSPPGANLAGVAVVVAIGGSTVASGTTGPDGNVILFVRGQGSAFVNVTRAGYISLSITMTLRPNTTTSLTITLDRFPSLSGKVRDGLTGAPIRGATVDLLLASDGTVARSTTTDNQGSYRFASIPTGTYIVRATASGYVRNRTVIVLAPNEIALVDFALVPDSIPPTSMVTSPAPGGIETTVEFVVTATASDPNGNEILQVDLWYSYNNTAFVKWATDTSAPFAFGFNASQASGDGRYGFLTVATDAAGNVEARPAANDTWVLVDARPPVSHVQALPAYANTTSFAVTATASDDAGVREVELWYNKDAGAFAKFGTATAAPYAWTFTTTQGDGAYGFYTVAVDIAGNREAAPTTPDAQITIDTVAPSLTITAPSEGVWVVTSSVAVMWTATDAGSGAALTQVSVDGGAWRTVTGTNTTLSDLADGPHTVGVRATDGAGNARTVSRSFQVDATPPTLTVTAPPSGATVATVNVTVTWTASDAGSGIDHYEIRIDGGSFVSTGTAQSQTFRNLNAGSHTVTVRAHDVAGNVREVSTTFVVEIPVQPTGGFSAPLLIGSGAVVVIVAIALAVWASRRRRTRRPPAP